MKKSIFLTFSTTPSSYRFLIKKSYQLNSALYICLEAIQPRVENLLILIPGKKYCESKLKLNWVKMKASVHGASADAGSCPLGVLIQHHLTSVQLVAVKHFVQLWDCAFCAFFLICSALMIICFSWIPDQLKSVKCRELGNVHNVQGKIFDQWLRDPSQQNVLRKTSSLSKI